MAKYSEQQMVEARAKFNNFEHKFINIMNDSEKRANSTKLSEMRSELAGMESMFAKSDEDLRIERDRQLAVAGSMDIIKDNFESLKVKFN